MDAAEKTTVPRAGSCDLVMKGGVSSGVVYPAAVLAMRERYRFVNLGGASAGAIAAAATAAAEYARESGGFTRLEGVRTKLQEPGLLPRLFQPTKEARAAFGLLLALQGQKGAVRKGLVGVGRLLRRIALPLSIQVAAVFCLAALAIGAAGGDWRSLGAGGWIALSALLLLSTLIGFLGTVVVRGLRLGLSHLPSSNFGMCLGKAEGRSKHHALTEWLHEQVQDIAFGDPKRVAPLTFADLTMKGIKLRLMTTDVTRARPVRLPYTGDAYWFARSDLEALFPTNVLDHMTRTGVESRPPAGSVPELHRFPGEDLPVLVATRMSLSLPALLAAVPLWTIQDGKAVRHWLSDGGIASNFPIHFFDAWVPSRPTFGLTLVPEARVEQQPDSIPAAVEQHGGAAPPMRRARITSTVGFVRQILDTMQNWRDTMQSELPQFRDRVTDVKLGAGEGGMNIAMPPEVIRRIDRKGDEAGQRLVQFDWSSHQLQRYASFMRLLQRNLRQAGATDVAALGDVLTPEFFAWLASGAPGVNRPLPGDRSPDWYAKAASATQKLVADASAWLDAARELSFVIGPEETPASVMRISPDV